MTYTSTTQSADKVFPGQAKNEKVLIFKKENGLSYLSANSRFIVTILIVSTITFAISYLYLNIYLAILLAVLVALLGIVLLFYFRNNSFFILTNKRLIKFIKNSLFAEHSKELKIDQINELTFTKIWLFPKLLNYWNIKIIWKDKEAAIWVRWINYPDEIVQYISRLRDFLIENPDFDYQQITPFIPRKIRKSKKI